jgi:hypothetical protein
MHLWPAHSCFETPNSQVKVVKNIIPAYHYALYVKFEPVVLNFKDPTFSLCFIWSSFYSSPLGL